MNNSLRGSNATKLKEQHKTAWETCWRCGGCGLQDGLYGPTSCYICKGGCEIRVRDDKGRFALKAVTMGEDDRENLSSVPQVAETD